MLKGYDQSRLLLAPGSPDRQTYYVVNELGALIATFITGGVNNKTADETAIRNVADMSEYTNQKLTVVRALATADGGLIEPANRWPRR